MRQRAKPKGNFIRTTALALSLTAAPFGCATPSKKVATPLEETNKVIKATVVKAKAEKSNLAESCRQAGIFVREGQLMTSRGGAKARIIRKGKNGILIKIENNGSSTKIDELGFGQATSINWASFTGGSTVVKQSMRVAVCPKTQQTGKADGARLVVEEYQESAKKTPAEAKAAAEAQKKKQVIQEFEQRLLELNKKLKEVK